ncbi:LysR family transcriptional regulator [Pseudoalteromonas rubra]|uniref:HTH lysR-type domain-containing protein n=1 Tax=Pseudoalteromonas rubra TaxID=43658 RepID=A0A0U3HP67_9GAMM|nr:LysR family transcriptional regulator [Pseudoalteromonas rubra]ALU42760.1 hypothetical protein AT705_07185 [Pseudoalteromonas rubra]
MDTIDGLKAMVAVAECQSFTSASERLGMSKSLVSKYVSQLEQQTCIKMFNRTTRRVLLTESGKIFYHQALTVLSHYHQMLESAQSLHNRVSGTLRVSAPYALGETKLARILPKFMQSYPELRIDLLMSNASVNMIEEGIDVRLRVGQLSDSSLIVRKITQYPLVACASPEYLAKQGHPQNPEQLCKHSCIIDRNYKMADRWQFTHLRTRDTDTIEVPNQLSVNSPTASRELAKQGAGVILCPIFVVEEAIEKGELIVLFSDYMTSQVALQAVYPHRDYTPRKLVTFIDFLKQHL